MHIIFCPQNYSMDGIEKDSCLYISKDVNENFIAYKVALA